LTEAGLLSGVAAREAAQLEFPCPRESRWWWAGSALLLAAGAWSTLTGWIPDRWDEAVLQSAVGLAVTATAWRWRRQADWLLLNPWLGILLVVTVLCWVRYYAGWTECRFDTLQAALYWTALVGLFAAGLHVFGRPAARQLFVEAFFWLVVGIALSGLAQYYTAQGKAWWLFPTGYPDTFGPLVNRNHFAALIELALPAGLYRGVRQRSELHLVASALLIGCVVASGSRAGTVLVVLETVGLALLLGVRRARARWAWLVTLGIVGALAAGTGLLGRRLMAPRPLGYRSDLWASTLQMIRDRPWLGTGPGTYATVYPAYARFDNGQEVNEAHSDWLEWAAEGGIGFAGLLAAFVVGLARPALQRGWAIGLLAVAVHACVDYPLQRYAISVWFVLLAAALVSHRFARIADPSSGE